AVPAPRSPLPGLLFFFQAEDGIRDGHVTGVQTCALPISMAMNRRGKPPRAVHAPTGSSPCFPVPGHRPRSAAVLLGAPDEACRMPPPEWKDHATASRFRQSPP